MHWLSVLRLGKPQLRHSFDQSERKHIMYISATKDSIPTEFTNVAKSTEPVGGKGLIKTY